MSFSTAWSAAIPSSTSRRDSGAVGGVNVEESTPNVRHVGDLSNANPVQLVEPGIAIGTNVIDEAAEILQPTREPCRNAQDYRPEYSSETRGQTTIGLIFRVAISFKDIHRSCQT